MEKRLTTCSIVQAVGLYPWLLMVSLTIDSIQYFKSSVVHALGVLFLLLDHRTVLDSTDNTSQHEFLKWISRVINNSIILKILVIKCFLGLFRMSTIHCMNFRTFSNHLLYIYSRKTIFYDWSCNAVSLALGQNGLRLLMLEAIKYLYPCNSERILKPGKYVSN